MASRKCWKTEIGLLRELGMGNTQYPASPTRLSRRHDPWEVAAQSSSGGPSDKAQHLPGPCSIIDPGYDLPDRMAWPETSSGIYQATLELDSLRPDITMQSGNIKAIREYIDPGLQEFVLALP